MRVYTSGVFDLFHAGHLEALERARSCGDWLLVGVASDQDTATYKRPPVVSFEQRCRIVGALAIVDKVIQCPMYPTEKFYENWRIDVHCQGEDLGDFYELGKALGIVRFTGRSDLNDTTRIISRVLEDYTQEDACDSAVDPG